MVAFGAVGFYGLAAVDLLRSDSAELGSIIRPRRAGEVNQAWPLDEAWQIRFPAVMTSIIVALTCAAVPSLAIWGFVALTPMDKDKCP